MSLRAAASPETPFLTCILTSGDPLEQAERNWLAEAAADPSGDAP
jgi:hypothetical protein